MTNDSEKKGIEKFLESIYNFLTDEVTVKIFKSGITLNFAVLGLIFFLKVLQTYYTKDDPALIQATVVIAIAFFGTYGYLLNMLFKKDEIKSVMEGHMYTVIILAIYFAFTTWLDPTEPLTKNSVYYWLINITQMFVALTFFSMLISAFMFMFRQKTAKTSTDNSTNANKTKE